MAEVSSRKARFSILQKRLKEERLFVKNEKEQLRKLNEKVLTLSQNIFYLEWKTRKQWMNVDRLIWGGKANPAECSNTSRIIESVKFEDACRALNYEDAKYGQFLLNLKENPRLVALILDFCDNKRLQTSTRHLTRLLIFSLYGSCAQKKDEIMVLKILQELMSLQVLSCEDLLTFFCGKRSTDNAFACVLTVFSEVLFSSKLYLTAALHGTVMQVIVDDAVFLDVEVTKVLSRIPTKATLEKFGHPSTGAAQKKIKDHMDALHKHLVNLSKKFLKSLLDKIYCFPRSLRWAICELYNGMISKMKLPEANAKAIIGYLLMSYFICPAIINPEPYGINSDADISETARHNLSQIASILRSLALLDCGLKDEKLKVILNSFEQGQIMMYVSAILNGSENIQLEQIADDVSLIVIKSSLLMTEHDLKTMIKCIKLLQSCNVPSLMEEGIDELLDILPAPPRRWNNQSKDECNAKSMSPNINSNIHSSPVPSPRHNKLKNVNSNNVFMNTSQEDVEQLREDLNTMITADEPVLVISLGNETDHHPGMLPEEEVLGLKTDLSTASTFDIEATNADRRERTSSLMLDALMQDYELSTNLIDINDLDNISSDSNTSGNELNVIKSSTFKGIDELESLSFDSNLSTKTVQSFSDPVKAEVPVENLLNFTDESEDIPELPAKKHHYKPVKSVFDEPLISLENEVLTSHTRVNKRFSNVSLIGGTSEINEILKNAAITLPNTVKNNEFSDPWSPSTSSVDPWGATTETNASTDHGFENSFASPMPLGQPVKKRSPAAKKKLAVDPGYTEYSENIKKEQKIIKSNENYKDEDKLVRKKSHGAWIKDKISTTLSAGLKQHRSKSDGQIVSEGDTATDKIYRNLKKPGAVFTGTPMQASEASTKSSKSLSIRSNEGDISEAILAKYRVMSLETPSQDTPFGTPLPSQMEESPQMVEKEVITFNDKFKFDDAKRKLRTVLCTSDQTSLPSDATSFDHLMLTMLQVELAEAINLQDRFSVAQLHETLRSIKQLPNGSCENLIKKLEEDYQLRSKYTSYLINCKQGLLSTINHLEQVNAKMQRDRIICSNYFTTCAVRLFLETPDKKQEIRVFAQKFASNKMLDEKCALLSDFLAQKNSEMVKHPTWMYCTDGQLLGTEVATERAIISKIYKEAFYPNGVADIENDRIFHEHIKLLSKIITLSHPALQIPKMYQKEAPWPSAQTELLMVNAYKTAADKLSCIHRCCVTIMNLLRMASENHVPGADDFVPVLVYVVLRANPPNLLSTKQYVNTLYETRLNGEEYYCWMQFCAAIEFIKTMAPPNS